MKIKRILDVQIEAVNRYAWQTDKRFNGTTVVPKVMLMVRGRRRGMAAVAGVRTGA